VGPPPVTRPAFYALESGGWRDYITLLHPPYTAWHLSYVAIGAALAPEFEGRRLLAALAAFFLAMGVGAHALDELTDRPLQTQIPNGVLVTLAAVSIGGAVAIGIAASLAWTLWLLPFVAGGAFLVVAYNLELFGGLFHNYFWFGFAWGAFPLLTGYLVTAEELSLEALLAALFALLTSFVQRTLSTPVRDVRRRVTNVTGTVSLTDGTREEITPETLMGAPETALRLLAAAMVSLAAALLVLRF
jgi:heme O synthase-like polyprenyltransferase